MKATLFDSKGNKKSDIELPSLFNTPVREDLIQKFDQVYKFMQMQPYSHDPEAGRKHSASGTISHQRHKWKGHYGKGISRIPRKAMWRRGTQFFWIGAEVTSTRGGRRVHGPKLWKAPRKINKKEMEFAINSALSATTNKAFVIKRYSSLSNIENIPSVIENLPVKTKDMFATIQKIFNTPIVFKNKEVRAGKGKLRGRKYKSSAGLLLITSSSEKAKFKGIEVKTTKTLEITDLYPLGRITLFTKKSLEELGGKKNA